MARARGDRSGRLPAAQACQHRVEGCSAGDDLVTLLHRAALDDERQRLFPAELGFQP